MTKPKHAQSPGHWHVSIDDGTCDGDFHRASNQDPCFFFPSRMAEEGRDLIYTTPMLRREPVNAWMWQA